MIIEKDIKSQLNNLRCEAEASIATKMYEWYFAGASGVGNEADELFYWLLM